MLRLNMAIANGKKTGVFFCDMNESRWQLMESELQNMKTLKIWQTVDNRKDRQEVWFNILLGN